VTFADSVKYLFSLGNEVSAMKLGLENTAKLLAALGNPENKYLKVQVAGTNGKGSVCAFLDSICNEAGISTGRFTSPHLVSITERIRINGRDISESEFTQHANLVRETSECLLSQGELEYRPTFFEQITAIALVAFAEAGVKVAILETGLGGRLDATTAANAEIAAITRIDYDHQEYLGDTIEGIAAEKAAIIHKGSKAIVGPQTKQAEQVINGRCREVGVEPIWVSDDFVIKHEPIIAPAQFGTFHTVRGNYPDIEMWGMLGRHQFQNAAIAIAIAEILADQGFAITSEDIQIGLETTSHPGRLEYHDNFLFDGAHNVAGANALAAYLDEFERRPLTVIFGAMKGKDVSGIAEALFPRAKNLILTQPSNSRSMTAAELRDIVPAAVGPIHLTDTAREALALAADITAEDGLILVTGSLYLVGEAKKILNN
jgi:dihydrofolate synthase/folylpolyglutamate synthase